jgi:hypothetical protein
MVFQRTINLLASLGRLLAAEHQDVIPTSKAMSDILIAQLRQRATDRRRATDQSKRFPTSARSPIDEDSVRSAEASLGQALPALLSELYLRVGNGGFGPGYGVLPLLPIPTMAKLKFP